VVDIIFLFNIAGGNRQLDLVDSGDSNIAANVKYRKTYVYGNILVEYEGNDNRQFVHYGVDSGNTTNYRKGTLYFYHNTLFSSRIGRTTLFWLSTQSESCNACNNIIYDVTSQLGEGEQLELLLENTGTLVMNNNWMREGFVSSFTMLQGLGSVQNIDPVIGTGSNPNPGFADSNFPTTLDVGFPSEQCTDTKHTNRQ
jgi:hypothetical protein